MIWWFQEEVLSCSKINGDDGDDTCFFLLLPGSFLVSQITVQKPDLANFSQHM